MTDKANMEPPLDRFCDLVMKGGITSGAVYPSAIAQLSRHYRFKSIGGTSAGAIAAVLTAAAEFQRRKGSRKGFDLLGELPHELQVREPGSDKTKLLSLFQPQTGTHRLFDVLVGALNKGSSLPRMLAVASGFLRAYWPATVATLIVPTAAIYLGAYWPTAALAYVFVLALAIGYWVYRDLTVAVVANGFGLCTGLTSNNDQEALTPWLHRKIQEAAGLPAGSHPLTFGQLWDAGGLPDWLAQPKGKRTRSIDLRMYSTNLAHGRPYVFPLEQFDDPAPDQALSSRFRSFDRLYYQPDALRKYLPEEVVHHLVAHSRPYVVEPGREGKDPDEDAARGLLEIPSAEDFPVLLAARMSLSFPILISAIPLWAIDYDLPHGKRRFSRCLFADGGISSNFPMHLFDGLLPRWPTFGINLEGEIPGRSELVYLPQEYEKGYGERWNRFAEPSETPTQFGGFLSAIVSTMQNWNDNSLARMPGVRDRVVRLRLRPHEGGLNLNMRPETIDALAERGREAATELVTRFAPDPVSGKEAPGWDEHRWIRLNVLLKIIAARVPAVISAVDSRVPHAKPFPRLIEEAAATGMPDMTSKSTAGYEMPFSQADKTALIEALQTLTDFAKAVAGESDAIASHPIGADAQAMGAQARADTASAGKQKNAFRSIPAPELRVRPSL